MKKNARSLRIVVALSLCVVCLCATTGSALARTTYTTTIDFTAGKDAYGPGGSNYHKKGNTSTNWNATYQQGWNATTSVYLYDQQYGDRATHIEPVTRGQNTGECVYLGTACCQSSHKYKIVAKRDISQYSGAYTFVYEWTM